MSTSVGTIVFFHPATNIRRSVLFEPDAVFAAIVAKARGNVRNALMMLEVKLLVAEPQAPPAPQPVQRTWFDTAKAANDCPVPLNGAKRMKRILVKNADGKWVHEMAEVTA